MIWLLSSGLACPGGIISTFKLTPDMFPFCLLACFLHGTSSKQSGQQATLAFTP